MNTHETVVREETVEIGSDRSLGLIVGGVLSALGAYQLYNDSSYYLWSLSPGVLLVSVGLLIPNLLHPRNRGWAKFGLLLGRIVTPLVMYLVNAITVVPIGLALRLSGKDLLSLKRGEQKKSYWIERLPPGPPPESLKDQF